MSSKYRTTIGLEIHAELKTRTKMFCSCLNDFSEIKPNINVCPVCLGHPGVMPIINKKAIEEVIKLGLALNGEILDHSQFDRKSYFYPDLPKGYQISQYELPLVKGGELAGVQVRRIHLEEDTARLLHSGNESLVDFNRAGVPLMELVTEPVIDSSEKALEFGRELQLVLRYLDISDADMEKGQFRVEANVSVAPYGHEELGTKVELKNINSFRAVKNALAYEIERQKELLEKGEKVVHETRGWNEAKGMTISQRRKEEAHDYRYLPEPDLPPMEFVAGQGINLEELKISLPELPGVKRKRFATEYELPEKQVEVLISDRYVADYFERAVSEFLALEDEEKQKRIRLLANNLTTNLIGLLNRDKISIQEVEGKIPPQNFAKLTNFVVTGITSSTAAVSILTEMAATGLDPDELVAGKTQISDESEITKIVKKIIIGNPDAVESYKKGKTNSLQFLAGQVMAEAKGRANPQVVQEILKKTLD
ncbi:MAG: Asp-tRNA(Asn)/Glu-tRNA(Gln) amidotransferase subunit GatB [bacterium]|nr:Asp-tRNA(Asn)/Glu-tRNA(Gln) amidotransferase subunit GatB [bacterium]